jgi:hypothetical protein
MPPVLVRGGDRPEGVAKVAERLGLAIWAAELPVDGEAFLQAGDGLVIPPQPLVHSTEVGQADGLTVAVAQLLVDRKAFLQAGDRVVRLPQPLMRGAEVRQAGGLAVMVAELLG